MAKSIGELSVFVDESGSFDSSLEPSRFYIVTLLCHDQADVVKPFVDELESQLGYLGYPDTCIHAGPLLRREEDFRAVEIETRRKLFGRMLAFTRKLPASYLSLVVDKQEHTTPEAISEELKRQLVDFFGKWRDLKKNYLAPLRRLSMAIPSGFEG